MGIYSLAGGNNKHTSVHMRLLRQLIIRVTVRVNRAVQLLECHERHDELIVGVQQAAKPLFGFDMMNLITHMIRTCP